MGNLSKISRLLQSQKRSNKKANTQNEKGKKVVVEISDSDSLDSDYVPKDVSPPTQKDWKKEGPSRQKEEDDDQTPTNATN